MKSRAAARKLRQNELPFSLRRRDDVLVRDEDEAVANLRQQQRVAESVDRHPLLDRNLFLDVEQRLMVRLTISRVDVIDEFTNLVAFRTVTYTSVTLARVVLESEESSKRSASRLENLCNLGELPPVPGLCQS